MRETVVLHPLQREQEIRVPRGAAYTIHLPIHGDSSSPQKLRVILDGEGAEADVYGLYVGQGRGHASVQVDTIHTAHATRGHVRIDAVLAGESVFDFRGTIHIASRAQQSNGMLHQHSLLLSEDARADSVPALEIEANDVKAFHAATAAPIDPLQLFFLMSRGLSQSQAEGYIVRGFANAVLMHMPSGLRFAITKRLNALCAPQ